MRWEGRRESGNIEDRRGMRGPGGGGLPVMLLQLLLSRFGLRGVLVVVVGAFVLSAAGVNPLALLGGGAPVRSASAPSGAPDDATGRFLAVVLADTEDAWSEIFAASGRVYVDPTLVLFSGSVATGCGNAGASAGPFYCPADRKLYLDTDFFRELSGRFGAPGDFAEAYVVAHEVGHHVQALTGVSDQVGRLTRRASKVEANAVQVRMELQADCYAGVWAHHANKTKNVLDPGDLEEALAAAAAVGDDTLQRQAGRRVVPETFTHGAAAQRAHWFRTGFETGDMNACDTFGAAGF